RLYQVAGNAAETEKLMGPGWELVAGQKNPKTQRFYVEDTPANQSRGIAGTGLFAGFRVDATNKLPLLDVYGDEYADDKALSLTRAGDSVRFRGDQFKREIQFKHHGQGPKKGYMRFRCEGAVPTNGTATFLQVAQILETLDAQPPIGRYH